MGTAPTDQDLWVRVAKGDEQALEAWYAQHVDSVYAFVFYRVGRDASLAEDVVQDTFLAALEKTSEFDPARGSMRSWLCIMSRNIIRHHLRLRAHGDELAEQWDRVDGTLTALYAAFEGAPLSDEVIARRETQDLVNMTIDNMPERYRGVLMRKYVEGCSLDDIAHALDLPSADAAKSLLARARRAFRETFEALQSQLELPPEVKS